MRTAEQNQRRAEALADEAVNIFRNAEELGNVFDNNAGVIAERSRGAQLGALAQVYATLATIATAPAPNTEPPALELDSRVVCIAPRLNSGPPVVAADSFGTVLSLSPSGKDAIVRWDDSTEQSALPVDKLAVVFGV